MAPVCHGVCQRYKPNWAGNRGSARYSETVDVQCATLGYLLRVEQTTTDVIVVMY